MTYGKRYQIITAKKQKQLACLTSYPHKNCKTRPRSTLDRLLGIGTLVSFPAIGFEKPKFMIPFSFQWILEMFNKMNILMSFNYRTQLVITKNLPQSQGASAMSLVAGSRTWAGMTVIQSTNSSHPSRCKWPHLQQLHVGSLRCSSRVQVPGMLEGF